MSQSADPSRSGTATRRRGREIGALTGLRGVAACWVVEYHVHERAPLLPGSPLGTMLRHGYLAVDLFFVLSGFVMALSYEGLFAGGASRRALGTFALRRLARIYPLYAAVTGASVLLFLHFALATGAPCRPLLAMLPYNVPLLQTWGFGDGIVGQSWSVSAEMAAYVLFPFLLRITGAGRPPPPPPPRRAPPPAAVAASGMVCHSTRSTWTSFGPAAKEGVPSGRGR